jgi:LuxR family transcriptional regulator, maltose regulon positive regulatory protein
VSASALPLLYVLVPDLRARWDASPPPGHFADLLELVRALVDLRERASLDGVRTMSPAARPIMLGALPPTWVTELAAAMVAVGQDEGRALLEQIGAPARSVLRQQLDHARSPIATTARALLRQLPAVPPHQLQVRTLGPLELRRDGVEVAAPKLRRERVRQLLAYLLTHERPARAAITAELWPDLDDAAAGRNLRVTLGHLQDVLGFERQGALSAALAADERALELCTRSRRINCWSPRLSPGRIW